MPNFPTIDASLVTSATAMAFESEFFDVYAPELPNVKQRLEGVMTLGLPSKAADTPYHYFETSAHPRIWKRGDAVSQDGFRGRSWTVTNFYYGKELTWYTEDEDDDQTGQLMVKAQELGKNFAILTERLFFQVLTAGTDADLLATAPTAPDGAAMFSATNGDSGNRFGVSGGNIVTGQGVATTEAIEDDYIRGITRMQSFQDTKGQPRTIEESLRDFVIICPLALSRVMYRTFYAETVQGANAGISGISELGSQFPRPRIWATQRLSGSDWYLFNKNITRKAIFEQIREDTTSNIGDFSNSDRTRSTRVKSLQFYKRLGIGLGVPYQCIKIDN